MIPSIINTAFGYAEQMPVLALSAYKLVAPENNILADGLSQNNPRTFLKHDLLARVIGLALPILGSFDLLYRSAIIVTKLPFVAAKYCGCDKLSDIFSLYDLADNCKSTVGYAMGLVMATGHLIIHGSNPHY